MPRLRGLKHQSALRHGNLRLATDPSTRSASRPGMLATNEETILVRTCPVETPSDGDKSAARRLLYGVFNKLVKVAATEVKRQKELDDLMAGGALHLFRHLAKVFHRTGARCRGIHRWRSRRHVDGRLRACCDDLDGRGRSIQLHHVSKHLRSRHRRPRFSHGERGRASWPLPSSAMHSFRSSKGG